MLLNSFSANMLSSFPVTVEFHEINAHDARLMLMELAEEDGEGEFIQSAVGHADTAAVFSSVLGIPVPVKRVTVNLEPGDSAIIAQYKGSRLPEGATAEGAEIVWLFAIVGHSEE